MSASDSAPDNIDHQIRAALHAEDVSCFDELDEQSIQDMLVGLFQGKSRWFATAGAAGVVVFVVAAIVAVIRFFAAESTREMIVWATAFLFCGLTIAMFKIWYAIQISQNAMSRELKRMELQLARLAGQNKEF